VFLKREESTIIVFLIILINNTETINKTPKQILESFKCKVCNNGDFGPLDDPAIPTADQIKNRKKFATKEGEQYQQYNRAYRVQEWTANHLVIRPHIYVYLRVYCTIKALIISLQCAPIMYTNSPYTAPTSIDSTVSCIHYTTTYIWVLESILYHYKSTNAIQ
jgi:hypothetical protein